MFAFLIFTVVVGAIIYMVVNHSSNSNSSADYAPSSSASTSEPDEQVEDNTDFLLDAFSEGTPPYSAAESTLHCLTNEELMNKERSIASRLHKFYRDNCFTPEYLSDLAKYFDDFAASEESRDIFFIGDIVQCFKGMGLDVNVYTPHGMLLTMSLFYLKGLDDHCDSFKFGMTKKGVLESAQNACDEVVDIYKMFKGYDPFVISSLLVNIDLEKRKEYLDLLIELANCLVDIKDENPSKSTYFIASLAELQLKDGSDIEEPNSVPSDADPVEIWGLTEPVLDHEEVSETWTTNVAGVSLHCGKEDIGGIIGYVKAEPTNTYNPNAMAVYLHTGKLIGYIADRELDDYRYWSRCKTMPFVGYINVYNSDLSARIHIMVPKSRKFLVERAGKFYISTKEKGDFGLIPNVVDMIVPDRD